VDVRGFDPEAAPVRLLRVPLDRHYFVERLVVADVVLAVGLHRALLHDGLGVVDRHRVAAVGIDHIVLDVLGDDEGRIGTRVVRRGEPATREQAQKHKGEPSSHEQPPEYEWCG
jgi:hypothetical protein